MLISTFSLILDLITYNVLNRSTKSTIKTRHFLIWSAEKFRSAPFARGHLWPPLFSIANFLHPKSKSLYLNVVIFWFVLDLVWAPHYNLQSSNSLQCHHLMVVLSLRLNAKNELIKNVGNLLERFWYWYQSISLINTKFGCLTNICSLEKRAVVKLYVSKIFPFYIGNIISDILRKRF